MSLQKPFQSACILGNTPWLLQHTAALKTIAVIAAVALLTTS